MPQGQFTCPEEVKSGAPAGRQRPVGRKARIGEVQASVWDEQTQAACRDAGVVLL